MLIVSLILSAVLLLVANGIVRATQKERAGVVVLLVVFGLAPLVLLSLTFIPVALQTLFLFFGAVVWGGHRGGGRSSFLRLSCGATVAAYAVAGVIAANAQLEYARLRARYPYQSMEVRLPAPKPLVQKVALHPDTALRLDKLEPEISTRASGYRKYQLRLIHEHALQLFIDSPGFGLARMVRPGASSLAAKLPPGPAPLQPGVRDVATWSPGAQGSPPVGDLASLGDMLERSILDFVNPRGFGYFKDSRHVAGFETHRFHAVPAPADRWNVQTLELVSLVLHDDPEVYVSDRLPRMEPRAAAPTRPLDRFEWFGLRALRQGEDLFLAQTGEDLRMLGAVRSTNQCVTCHGCERGDLLGAFTYTLRREEGGGAGE